METTHSNFKSFVDSLNNGEELFIVGTPAFLNNSFLKRYNLTSEILWDTLPIFPKHFDRIYFIRYTQPLSTYTFHIIARLEVDHKTCYLDLLYTKQETHISGRIYFWDNHYTFLNSLPLSLINKIKPLLEQDGIIMEDCMIFQNSLHKIPSLVVLSFECLLQQESLSQMQVNDLPANLKSYFKVLRIAKKVRKNYNTFEEANPAIYTLQTRDALYTRATPLWSWIVPFVLFLYHPLSPHQN